MDEVCRPGRPLPNCPWCRHPRARPAHARVNSRRTAAFAAALVLVMYGLAAGPSAAVGRAPGTPDCAAFTSMMRQLAMPLVDAAVQAGTWEDGAESESLLAQGLGSDREFVPMSPGQAATTPPDLGDAVGSSPTGTNVAERAVDEPDFAKVDGTRLLRLWQGPSDGWELAVVDASGQTPRKVGALALPKGEDAAEMFVLDGHRVLVVGHVAESSPRRGDPTHTSKVVLTLVDTTDATRPAILRTAKVTGRYISSRLQDGTVRVVLSTAAPLEVSGPRWYESTAYAVARGRAEVRAYGAEEWLPAREILDSSGTVVDSGPALGCEDVHRTAEAESPNLLSVLAIDGRNGAEALDRAGGAAVFGQAEHVYASADRLYAALSDEADDEPDDGMDFFASRTVVHAFDTTGRRDTTYVGSGRVDGTLLGSSALSEHHGYLRMTVTDGSSNEPETSVVVLAEEAGRLREIGRVDGLGPFEDVRAVRWFGDLATVVTFRQTDPLYVVDLADPTEPRVLGELKIPGYSGYLHPLGGSRVLGVGQDADNRGATRGLQVSAFDIADPTAPVRTDVLTLPRGRADVEGDSRAFAYLPDARLAVVPGWLRAPVRCAEKGAAGPDAWLCRTEQGPLAEGIVSRKRVAASGTGVVPAALGITVDEAGRLRETGRFLADSPVLRVLPVAGRLAVVTETSVVLLDPSDLRRLGTVLIDSTYRYEGY